MYMCVLQLLQNTGGSVAGLPSSLAAVLHSLACHGNYTNSTLHIGTHCMYMSAAGAIKFGDSLCLAECKQLIHSLTCCALPFQCAHGRSVLFTIIITLLNTGLICRPSVVPLIDLHLLRTQFPSLVSFHIAYKLYAMDTHTHTHSILLFQCWKDCI